MTQLAMDIAIEEMIYEEELNVKKFARAILNLSRIGNIKGANHYRQKLSESRNVLRYTRDNRCAE